MIDIDLLNGSNLSYIGDGYYEVIIRKHLLSKGITNSKKIHQEATKYVSSHAHSIIIDCLINEFSEKELEIYKRGRNHKNQSRRKNIDLAEHSKSSGFEAVIGYLYLKEEYIRLDEIITKAINIIEGKN